jgi:hypothetical protein
VFGSPTPLLIIRAILLRNHFISIVVSTFLRRRLSFACCALSVVAAVATGSGAQIGIGSGLRVVPPAMSLKDLRDQNVVKQRFDFSCGAAALATLLRYGFGDSVTESQILVELFNLLSEEEKTAARSMGFSLLHLQRVAQARGYNAQGFRLEPEQLSMLGGPVIVFIEPRGYKHFAVLRGMSGDRVYLADPSRGNIRLPAYSFLKSWLQDDDKGIIFVVEPKTSAPDGQMPLTLARVRPSRPEIMSAREMLAVGNAFLQWPELSR